MVNYSNRDSFDNGRELIAAGLKHSSAVDIFGQYRR